MIAITVFTKFEIVLMIFVLNCFCYVLKGFACIFLNPLFGILGYIIFFGSAGVVIIGIIPGPKNTPGEYGLKTW
jgi:hypothetical protein